MCDGMLIRPKNAGADYARLLDLINHAASPRKAVEGFATGGFIKPPEDEG